MADHKTFIKESMPGIYEQIIASNPRVYKHKNITKTSSVVSEALPDDITTPFNFVSDFFLLWLTLVWIAIFSMFIYSKQNYLPPNLSYASRNLEDFISPTTIYVLLL